MAFPTPSETATTITRTPMATIVPLARYRFHFRNAAPLHLPEYSLSLWRGSFGRALKQAVCVVLRGQCERCLLRSHCLYPQFFDQTLAHGAFAAPPRPFVLSYAGDHGRLTPGSELTLSMVLFGAANDSLPYIVHAMERLGRNGLGRERAGLDLLMVEQQDPQDRWQAILDQDQRRLQPLAPAAPSVPTLESRLCVQLTTPLRLKFHGRHVRPQGFDAAVFLRALYRRWQLLSRFFGDDTLPQAPDDDQLAAITAEQVRLRWHDWTRWSARQGTEMQLGGLLGQFELDLRPLPRLWPLLWWGQWSHVGNAASFGLGGYRLINGPCANDHNPAPTSTIRRNRKLP
jgi:hypothetical protein